MNRSLLSKTPSPAPAQPGASQGLSERFQAGVAAKQPRAWPALTGHLLVHALVFAAAAWWSWRRWPDPLIDFGRELYVPWQLTEGKVLYRDLTSLFGPLSPYLNAAFFRLFGVSLTTLVACNLAILAATAAGVHYLVRTACRRATATLVTVCMLTLFGFAEYVTVGNYNFVAPYSHEATHGFALGVAALVALHRAIVRHSVWMLALSGACFGLVLLTKPEVALAVAAAIAVGMAAAAALTHDDQRLIARGLPLFALATLVAPVGFFAYFAAHMTPAGALEATAGAWRPLWAPRIATGDFYRLVTGLDEPAANALRMAWLFAVFLAVVAAATVVARRAAEGPPERGRGVGGLIWIGGTALLLLVAPRGVAFPGILPLTTLTALAGVTLLFLRNRRDRPAAVRLIALLMWCGFALTLLAKMSLNPRIFHYGFYLALPATTVLIVLVVWLLPRLLARRYSFETGRVFRRIALAMFVAAVVPYLVLADLHYQVHRLPIGSGGDLFYAADGDQRWQGAAVAEAVGAIRALSGPADTVAVLPEGVMLNYLSRRESPLRVTSVMPPELLAFGEHAVFRDLQVRPPMLVVLVERDMTEYGYPRFGTDARYGRAIATWVDEHYEPVRRILRNPRTGEVRVTILRRRAAR